MKSTFFSAAALLAVAAVPAVLSSGVDSVDLVQRTVSANTTVVGRSLYERSGDDDFDGIFEIDERELGEWHEVPVGVMMKRDISLEDGMSSVVKRGEEKLHRFLGRMTIGLPIGEDGNLIFPRSFSEAASFVKRAAKTFSARITWYNGHDLLNPACLNKSNFQPRDNSMIAAATERWSAKPNCGDFLQITAPGSRKSIIVRRVDDCAGCTPQKPWIDLTQGAFKKLASLNTGELNGVKVRNIGPRAVKFTSSNIKLYGPASL